MQHPVLGQHPAPTHVIAHLSDTHLLAADARLYGTVDVLANLRLAVERLDGRDEDLAAIVLTGDLADLGQPGAYEAMAPILDELERRHGCPVIRVMGNHDERSAVRDHLLSEPEGASGPLDRVDVVDGLRIITLDSSVPGYHHGALDDAQLDRLADVLATPAPHGTILALHHPPIPTPLGAMAVLELQEQQRLAAIVRGTDVRAILAGHLHYPTTALFAGIPVFVAGAVSYTMDVGAPVRGLVGVDGAQSFSLVHVYPEVVTSSVVPLHAHPRVTAFGDDLLDRLESATPAERIEIFSRMPDSAPRLDDAPEPGSAAPR